MTEFESLEAVLKTIGIFINTGEAIRHEVYTHGECYDKSQLQVLGAPRIIQPSHMGPSSRIEKPCELYEAEYKEGTLVVVLPQQTNEKFDDRRAVFTVKDDQVQYFIDSNMGYSSFTSSPIKSLQRFPTPKFEEMTDEDTRDFVERFGMAFLKEGYEANSTDQQFAGCRRIFEKEIITHVECDNGSNSSFNPMYFLLRTTLGSHEINDIYNIMGLTPEEAAQITEQGRVNPSNINTNVIQGHFQAPDPNTHWTLEGSELYDHHLLWLSNRDSLHVKLDDNPVVVYQKKEE